MTRISSVAAAYDRRTTKILPRRLGVFVDAEECKMKRSRAALGFRVKSGWAVAILIGGSVQSPHVSDNRVIELSDPHDPTTRQPYHAAVGKLEANAANLKRRTQSVNRMAKKAVADLLQQSADNGYTIRRAGLVVGSQIDPDAIANPHIRAHALEGRLFRTTLEAALQSRGIRCAIFTERDAYAKAAKSLGQSTARIKHILTDLGDAASGPWRAEQKLAALAAWISLR
jgi:hypothetical protein